jgi:hypothetical protein
LLQLTEIDYDPAMLVSSVFYVDALNQACDQ